MFKYAAGPTFSGLNSDFNPWTRDVRYYAKRIGLLAAFVSELPEHIPIGKLDIENEVFTRRYSSEGVQRHTLAQNYLSTALKSKSD